MIREILAVTGKPGLFKLVSRGNKMLIAETLDSQKKRVPIYVTNQVVGLSDISVYTNDGNDIPLAQVFENIGSEYSLQVVDIDHKKASSEEMKSWMSRILPNYDTDRVHIGDMRKMLQWYNILINNGITQFQKKEDQQENKKERSCQK
ncbi:MAG: DUF5606 domain-containing protein [Prevotellaceae bacterium]|nr:DUF5606 domain-containing protein [Candidatus Colivivens equi]